MRYKGSTQEEYLKLQVVHASYAKSARHVLQAKASRKVAAYIEAVKEATRSTAQKKTLALALKQ